MERELWSCSDTLQLRFESCLVLRHSRGTHIGRHRSYSLARPLTISLGYDLRYVVENFSQAELCSLYILLIRHQLRKGRVCDIRHPTISFRIMSCVASFERNTHWTSSSITSQVPLLTSLVVFLFILLLLTTYYIKYK